MKGSSLPPAFADRLIKLLGMIGSAHDGEALNAAKLANKLVREASLTWSDVIGKNTPAPPGKTAMDPETVANAIAEIYESRIRLSSREISFLSRIPELRFFSENQLAWLHGLLDRARAKMAEPPPPKPQKPRKARPSRKPKGEPKSPPNAGDAPIDTTPIPETSAPHLSS